MDFKKAMKEGSKLESASYKIADKVENHKIKVVVQKWKNAFSSHLPNTTCANQVALMASLFQFERSDKFKDNLEYLFNTNTLKGDHFRIGHRLLMFVHKWLLQSRTRTVDSISLSSNEEMINDIKSHGIGSAKLRYVGGSVIRKLIDCKLKLKLSKSSDRSSKSYRVASSSLGILQSLVGKEEELLHTSKYPNTLTEIQDREYGKLVWLSDGCYEFFTMLEIFKLQRLSMSRLVEVGGSLPDQVLSKMCSDADITQKWLVLTLLMETDINLTLKINTDVSEDAFVSFFKSAVSIATPTAIV